MEEGSLAMIRDRHGHSGHMVALHDGPDRLIDHAIDRTPAGLRARS